MASTVAAAAAFAPIAQKWSTEAKERAALRASLASFLQLFPTDGLEPLARAYYALALIDAGDLPAGEAQLAILETLPPGATRDLVVVARAKDQRLRGHAEAAFDGLRPLVGKEVDATTRAILQEEVSLAAIEGKRDYEAIAYFDTWLRNAAEEDHDSVRAKVAAALAREPEPVLMDALRAMRSAGPSSGYGREIQKLVTERLAAIAIERKDSDLARWLVTADTAGALLGEAEGALGELATTKRGLATVDGRTIGLVLPTGSSDLRDEAAAILRGAASALDLPRDDPSKGDRTKLMTRDDGGDVNRVEPTMSELAGEGAVVILAALDPTAAARAVKWGEVHGVAVVTFAVPSGETPRDWTFTVGVPRDGEIAALAEELVSRAVVKIVPIVPPGGSPAIDALAKGTVQLEPPVPCDTAAAQSGEAHFPIDDWKRDHARVWLVDAPSECARDLVRGLDAAQLSGVVALTLDAAGSSARSPLLKTMSVHVGEIPVVGETSTDPEIRAWTEASGGPPNFWSALGHDAAVLARRAVAALPLDATSDAAAVSARRAAAKSALLTATAHLWTSESRGFASAHVLPRILGVEDLPADKVAKPVRGR